jgi:excisionase family DNA binding protein
MEKQLLTPLEAAILKGVSRAAIYTAIKEGRLPHTRILGRIALKKSDVAAWTPMSYKGRPGVNARRPKGLAMSEEAKARISESQKRRWEQRKQASLETSSE